MDDREAWLAATSVDLSEAVGGTFQAPAYGAALTSALAEVAASADTGVVVPADGAEPAITTATAPVVSDLLTRELELGDGPCLSCFRSRREVLNRELTAVRDRWPAFGATALGAGFRTLTLLPMRRHAEAVGAVVILKSGDDVVTRQTFGFARILVEAATVGIIQRRTMAREARRSEQLQSALDSRVLIEQAKGVLAARLDVSPDAAFDLLRRHSRRHGRRLTDLASDVVSRGFVPPPPPEAKLQSRRPGSRRA